MREARAWLRLEIRAYCFGDHVAELDADAKRTPDEPGGTETICSSFTRGGGLCAGIGAGGLTGSGCG